MISMMTYSTRPPVRMRRHGHNTGTPLIVKALLCQ
jgi:hypothetical protein